MKLLLTQALFTVHQKIKIEDDKGQLRYTVKSGLIDIKDKTIIENADGDVVARVERKPVSIHEVHKIHMETGKVRELEIAGKLIDPISDDFRIKGNDWKIKGRILEHDYKIIGKTGKKLATVHKKWLSLREVYVIDVEKEERMDTIVAVVIALEHIIQDRITKDKKIRKAEARG